MRNPNELDFREMREMLRAMQAGELTVSRGIEILEMWSAGNWSDDMLPPVRQDLIEEDSMPVEIIDRLNSKLEIAQVERNHARACYDRAIMLLTGIHSLLYPAPITTEDGRTMVFRPKSVDPHEVLQELSERIRALPDEIAAIGGQPTTKDNP